MSDELPGKGLFGWFGRQVGYVAKAVKTKPALAPPAERSAKPSAPQSGAAEQPTPPAVLYRQGQVQEAEHPSQPGVKLRRTIIDEVIVDETKPQTKPPDEGRRGSP
jgi:hypothetical protein